MSQATSPRLQTLTNQRGAAAPLITPRGIALAVLVATPILFNAVALAPALIHQVPFANDDAQHLLEVRDAAAAWASGKNPLDFWVSEVEMGFPDFLYYQSLPQLVVATAATLAGGVDSARTFFDITHYALLVGFPLTVFWSMRRMGCSDVASAFGAAASSLLSSDFRYGFAYDSYVWRGNGLFTQLWAMHLSFITIANLQRVATRGSGVVAAAISGAALVLSHFLYAYVVAVCAVIVLAIGLSRANARARLGAFATVAALAALISSHAWLPFFTEAAYVNVPPFLDQYKYDSFGAPSILGWLVSGDLFDHGRLPILTMLLAVGIVTVLRTRGRPGVVALALFTMWLVLYFGRPTLGGLVDLLPLRDGLFLHRLIGPVDLFAIILMGLGGAALWRFVSGDRRPRRLLLVTAASLLLMAPLLAERGSFYGQDVSWLTATEAAIDSDGDLRKVLAELRRLPPGRVYAGTYSNWGRQMNFGLPFNSVRVLNVLTDERLDALAPPYRGVSFDEGLVAAFADADVSHYRLFDIAYVIAPPTASVPAALQVVLRTGRYVLYSVPAGGIAEYGPIVRTLAPASRAELFYDELNWLTSGGPARWSFIRFNYPNGDATGPSIGDCPAARIEDVKVKPGRYEMLASCPADSAIVLKVSYHPNWHVTVDGTEVKTFMVSPSYVGFALPRGTHRVVGEYRSTPVKGPLAAIGLIAAIGSLMFASRARLRALRHRTRLVLAAAISVLCSKARPDLMWPA